MTPSATATASRAPQESSCSSADCDAPTDITRYTILDQLARPTWPRSSRSSSSLSSAWNRHCSAASIESRRERLCGLDSTVRRPSNSQRLGKSELHLYQQQSEPVRFSPDPPTLVAFASSFQSLLDSQAPFSSTHSAYSELLSVATSAFPPSTLPISALTDFVGTMTTPSTLSSSKSCFSSVATSSAENSMVGVGVATTAGLDLLGILAEEVDWDPQQKGSPAASAQLAVLGQNVQFHHEAKQKLWAGHILGSLGLIEPDGSRRNSFSTLTSALPSMQQRHDVDAKARLAPKFEQPNAESDSSSQAPRPAAGVMDDPLNTMTLTKRTALFYENLYERLCPGIVPRAYIYPRLGRKSHDHDASFAALALSISLLGLLRLTLPKSATSRVGDKSIEAQLEQSFLMPSVAPNRSSKAHDSDALRIQATQVIEQILLLRSSAPGGGISFGQAPTLETVLTALFLSMALYNLDTASHQAQDCGFTEWKDAAFFRFCEAITLAKILGLDQVGCAALGNGEQASEAVKVWMLLVRAERWWAEQRPDYVCQMEPAKRGADNVARGRKRVKSDSEEIKVVQTKRARSSSVSSKSAPLGFLTQLGLASVREHLIYRFGDLIECWTHSCDVATCHRLTPEAVVHVHDWLASIHHPVDPILVDLARQALRAKLWSSCLDHQLVAVDAHGPLRPDQSLHIALDALDLLEDLDQLVLQSLPCGNTAVDLAIREALQAVRDCVSRLPDGQFAEEAFSFEQIEASDESDSQCNASPRPEDPAAGAARSTTTMTRAAQSVIDNLDHFLSRVVS